MSKTRRHQKIFKKIGLFNSLDKIGLFEPSKNDFGEWLINQGPYCEGLVNYLSVEKDNYDVFIFFTYLYYPTNVGLPVVADKSILVPTAHDEMPFYFKGYQNIFEKTAFIMYNSESEKALVEKTYPIAKSTNNDIAGVGIDSVSVNLDLFSVPYDYLIYIGRIDTAKNVDELVDWFTKHNETLEKKMKLVLVGNNVSNLQGNEDIVFTGFISEEEKYNWLAHAKALIIPSLHESLSMVTLEAMAQGIPVIANANCEVLDDHIKQSKAGYSYHDYQGFDAIIKKLMHTSAADRKDMGDRGIAYVEKYYQWTEILKKFDEAFKILVEK